jgi:hypothetical protein
MQTIRFDERKGENTVKALVAFFIFALCSVAVCAQTPQVMSDGTTAPATVYVAAPAQGQPDLGPAIAAAVQKKDVPVTIVTDQKAAGYEIDYTLTSQKGNPGAQVAAGVLAGAWWVGRGSTSASFQVVDLSNSAVVFSYTVHKAGNNQKDFQSAVEAFAKHWKSYITKK